MNDREKTDLEHRTEILVRRCRRKGGSQSERAFAELAALHDPRLRQLAANFVPARWRSSEYDAADVHQVVLEGLWAAVRGYNPARGDFLHLASVIIHRELIADLKHRRAKRRWAGRENQPLSLNDPDSQDAIELAAPSWVFCADPLRVVIYRDDLRRGWEAMTTRQREAINAELARWENRQLDGPTRQAAAAGRRRALTAIHDTAPARRCHGCGTPLAPNKRPDARYCDDTCRARARWHAGKRQRLAAAGAVRQAA